MICDPSRSPWSYSPRYDAVPCNDGNPCTTDDRCDGGGTPVGVCYGRAAAPAGTACSDGFDCSWGDACDGAGTCSPNECTEELCAADCP